MLKTSQHAQFAKQLIIDEIRAVESLLQIPDQQIDAVCCALQQITGTVIVTGIGKSGHIACKIAATLSSTGTKALFMHPAEAAHGDFGIVTPSDIILAISHSGEAMEIITLIPLIKRLNVPMIAMTGNTKSTIAHAADFHLSIHVESEACPLGLAPTSSTTKTLVLGDALAVALLQAKGFTENDFGFSHPGGKLGRRLTLTVANIMHTDTRIPLIANTAKIDQTLLEINSKGFGICGVIEPSSGKLVGIFTDGDLRRTVQKQINIHTTPITNAMSTNCKTIQDKALVTTAINLMEAHRITALFVTDSDYVPIGIIHMHDIIKLGLV